MTLNQAERALKAAQKKAEEAAKAAEGIDDATLAGRARAVGAQAEYALEAVEEACEREAPPDD